jgi:Ca-activated chloride channel family protein
VSAAAGFQFLQPLWLWLLPPLWLLIWTRARRGGHESIWRRVCDAHLLAAMTGGQSGAVERRPAAWILGVVLSIGIIAAAAPSWSRRSYSIMDAASARVIVFDLSRSMLVQDVRPNRFRHALAAAGEIIGDGFGGETGLLVYAQSAFVLSPLSRDADSLLAFIEAVDPDTMPRDGNNLAAALDAATDLLGASLGGHGQIIVITAGDSLDQRAVSVASAAAARGNRVSVLAIGSAAGGPLLDQYGALQRDARGQIRISKTDFALLQSIAAAGNGGLAVAGGAGYDADLISSRIGASELVETQREVESAEREAADDGVWLVWLMLPPALLLFRRNLLWVLLVALLLPVDREAFAGDGSGFWTHSERNAVSAYHQGDYDTAIAMSVEPMLRGASHYRSGRLEQALEQFGAVDSASGRYNYANTLVRLQRYGEAIVSYRQALELDPDLGDARYNLRLLELFMQQQADPVTGPDSAGDKADATDDTAVTEALEVRIGIATELHGNPADEQQSGAGYGAAQQAGQVDPLERFDGEDLALERRFTLRTPGVELAPQQEFIERWIKSLPETSRELYRRIFLRDFLRQQQQQR